MGVHDYYAWITRTFEKDVALHIKQLVEASAIRSQIDKLNGRSQIDKDGSVATFSMDLNASFHTVAAFVYRYGEYENYPPIPSKTSMFDTYLEYLTAYIEFFIRMIRPHTLILAVDGPIPLAKIQQQRSRRFAKFINLDIPQNDDKTDDLKIDANCFTPGTEVMEAISIHIQKWIQTNQRQAQLNIYEENEEDKEDDITYIWPKRIIYSSHLVQGEGEHKIAKILRNLQFENVKESVKNHVIFGLDADLINIALLLNIKNIILLRESNSAKDYEDPRFLNIVKSIISPYMPYNIFNLDLFRSSMLKYIKQQTNTDVNIADFVILTFFVGNDFLPAPVAMSGRYLSDILEALIKTINSYNEHSIKMSQKSQTSSEIKKWPGFITKSQSNDIQIDYHRIRDFLFQLKHTETRLLRIEAGQQSRPEYKGNPLHELVASYNDKHQIDVTHFQNMYYNRIGFSDATVLKSSCNTYLQGLNWMIAYYIGHSINFEYVYHFYYSPMISSIYDELNSTKMINNIAFYNATRLFRSVPLTPFEQLVAVMPPQSANLLPLSLRHLLTDRDSDIRDILPHNVKVDVSGKFHNNQAVIFVPFVETRVIRNIVTKYIIKHGLTEAERLRNCKESDVVVMLMDV